MPRNDRPYKTFFSFPRTVEDLLRGFVAEPWVEQLDLSTLEKSPASYVSREFQERSSDAVWRVRWRGGHLYIYILLEFQSTDERFMALRLLVYVGLLYQDLQRRGELTAAARLPPVLPVVLYNGSKPWTSSLEMAELVEEIPNGRVQYRPSLRYLLIDEQRIAIGDLTSTRNVVAAIFRLQQSRSPQELREVILQLTDWLSTEEHKELRQAFAQWLSLALIPSKVPGAEVPEVHDLQEFKAMLEESVTPWTEQWKQEGFALGLERGREEGRIEGETQFLLRLLDQKFGGLDAATQTRVRSADDQQLLAWADRVLTARTLDEVFG